MKEEYVSKTAFKKVTGNTMIYKWMDEWMDGLINGQIDD